MKHNPKMENILMKKSTIVKALVVGATFAVAALCPIAGAVAGAIYGASAVAGTAASIAVGAGGFFVGGAVGGIVGRIVSLPGTLWLAAKAKKAVEKHGPELVEALQAETAPANVGKLKVKTAFAANSNKAPAAKAKAPAQKKSAPAPKK
jgi:hypothetical protein